MAEAGRAGISLPYNGAKGVGFSMYEARSSSLGAATDAFEIARTTVPAGTVAPLTRNFTSSRSFLLALYGWRLLGPPELGTVGPDTVQDYHRITAGLRARATLAFLAPMRWVRPSASHRPSAATKGSLWRAARPPPRRGRSGPCGRRNSISDLSGRPPRLDQPHRCWFPPTTYPIRHTVSGSLSIAECSLRPIHSALLSSRGERLIAWRAAISRLPRVPKRCELSQALASPWAKSLIVAIWR